MKQKGWSWLFRLIAPMAVAVVFLFLLFLVFAPPASGSEVPQIPAEDTPELYVNEPALFMSIKNGKVIWLQACGGELYAAPTYIKSKNIASNLVTTYFEMNLPCEAVDTHIASANFTPAGDYLYYLARSGWMHRANLTSGAVGYFQFVNPPTGEPSNTWLSTYNEYVFFNHGSTVYRVNQNTYAVSQVYQEATPPLFRPTALDANRLLYLSGGTLKVVEYSAVPNTWWILGLNVNDYFVSSDRIFWTERSADGYLIFSRNRTTLTDQQLIFEGPSIGHPYAAALFADSGYLYWQERVATGGDGPIYRIPLAGGSPARLTGILPGVRSIATDATHLYWLQPNTGIYRLPLGGTPPAITAGDLRITFIEVTQGTQAYEEISAEVPDRQLIPLAAGKPTLVRVHVCAPPDSRGVWSNIVGRLMIEGSGSYHLAGPLNASSLSSSGCSTSYTLDSTLNFMINSNETGGFTRLFTVTVDTLSPRPDADRSNNQRSFSQTFTPRPYTEIPVVRYANAYTGASCTNVAPDGAYLPVTTLVSLTHYVTNLTPVRYTSLIEHSSSGRILFDNSTCEAYLQAVSHFHTYLDYYYPNGGGFMTLLQPDPGSHNGTCWTFAGTGNIAINLRVPEPDTVLAHELAHAWKGPFVGPGDCCHTFNPEMGYPNYWWKEWMGPTTGYWLWPRLKVMDGKTYLDIWDLMSYHVPAWTSSWTACQMLNQITGGAEQCLPGAYPTTLNTLPTIGKNYSLDTRPLPGIIDPQKAGTIPLERLEPEVESPYLYVSGLITSTGEAYFNSMEIISSAKDITTPGSGQNYEIRLEDINGFAKATVSFDIPYMHNDPPAKTPPPALFGVYLPWDTATTKILLLKDSILLAERQVSLNPPSLQLLWTPPDYPIAGTQDIGWMAEDVDFDKMQYSVWYSANDGLDWKIVDASVYEEHLLVDFTFLAGSEQARIKVQASDGVLTGAAVSESFRVEKKAPKVEIGGPSTADANTAPVITGSAWDAEDGSIMDPLQYSWYSNWDGFLGNELFIDAANLSQGTHNLTLDVIDLDYIKGTASFTYTAPSTPGDARFILTPDVVGTMRFETFVPMTLTIPLGAIDQEMRFAASVYDGAYFDPPSTLVASFVITASTLTGDPVSTFSLPLQLELVYTDEQIGGGDETRLGLFVYDENAGEWKVVESKVDAENNRLTAVIPHLSRFAIGFTLEDQKMIFLPIVER